MKKSRIIILFLTLAAFGVVVALISAPAQLKKVLGDEGLKQLWQLSLATIVGGLVSTAFTELKREQDSIEARRQFLRTFHTGALAAYNRAKKCRRILLAKAVFDANGIPNIRQAEYETQMIELQDIQLQFEGLKRQVRLGTTIFTAASNLEAQLKTMEEYLRTVLREFETNPFPTGGTMMPLSGYPILQAFIAYNKTPAFVSGFADPYDEVELALVTLLTK
jgi:hypothetical protein